MAPNVPRPKLRFGLFTLLLANNGCCVTASTCRVNAESPIRTLRDLIEFGKTQRITFGNWATGAHAHMAAQQLAKKYALNVEPVAYKGEAAMCVDLASGQTTVAMGSALAMSPHLQSGKLRAVAVTTRARSPLLPQVPTFVEQGLPEPIFTVQGWVGMFAPVNTPRVRQINKTFGMAEKP